MDLFVSVDAWDVDAVKVSQSCGSQSSVYTLYPPEGIAEQVTKSSMCTLSRKVIVTTDH